MALPSGQCCQGVSPSVKLCARGRVSTPRPKASSVRNWARVRETRSGTRLPRSAAQPTPNAQQTLGKQLDPKPRHHYQPPPDEVPVFASETLILPAGGSPPRKPSTSRIASFWNRLVSGTPRVSETH